MKSEQVCEALGIKRTKFYYLVKRGSIRVVGHGLNKEYVDEDVRHLQEQMREDPSVCLARVKPQSSLGFSTERVGRAKAELLEALREACETGEMTRSEAQGKLSRFICMLWDEAEPVTKKLPQESPGKKQPTTRHRQIEPEWA